LKAENRVRHFLAEAPRVTFLSPPSALTDIAGSSQKNLRTKIALDDPDASKFPNGAQASAV